LTLGEIGRECALIDAHEAVAGNGPTADFGRVVLKYCCYDTGEVFGRYRSRRRSRSDIVVEDALRR
jgi:hypothetical protein